MWLLLACARDCLDRPPAAGEETECRVPGWAGRSALVFVPEGEGPFPLVVAFHGGGGKKEGMNRLTCAGGVEGDAHCLTEVARREGFAVAYPDGTPKALGSVRSWNAGGGADGWRCVGGTACDTGVDDLAYVDDLLDVVAGAVPIDAARIYATGMSNGAAMAHRLACDRAEVFAGIVAVGGANQALAVPGCQPARAIPVAQIHGTDDPCWAPDGTVGDCLGGGADRFVSVDDTMDAWASFQGCTGKAPPQTTADPVDPAFSATTTQWEGCAAAVELTWLDGAGHVWPGGWQYLPATRIGATPPGLVGSELVWGFLAR